ncbi:MAG: nucleotide exchange factor GrpE [Patescibacteria group bacterium]
MPKKHIDEQNEEEIVEEDNKPSEEVPEEKSWEDKATEYLDGWKRSQAEFANYQKRETEAKKELGGYLIEKLVLDIVPVLDNFHAANEHTPEDQRASPWVVGIQYIEKQLENVLADNGIQTIEAKEGDTFDPKIHEALSSEESEEENKEYVITKVHQKGYKYGDRVIRPAKVTVK